MPMEGTVAWGARPSDPEPPDVPLGSVYRDPALPPGELGAIRGPWPPRRALLALALAARTAAAGRLPVDVARWGAGHRLWPDEETSAVETSLAEALTNAVIHGCLGLPGMAAFRPDPQAYFDAVDAGLADDSRGLRPVLLVVRRSDRLTIVHVADSGAGFRPAHAGTAAAPASAAVSGRGLTLMRRLARRLRLSDGGRRTSLCFLRTGAGA